MSAPRFDLCSTCMALYRDLRRRDDATLQLSILPLSSMYWTDEHPDPHPEDGSAPVGPWMCEDRCRSTAVLLVAARRAYWDDEEVPAQLEGLWSDALAHLPDWPGFQRLYLAPEDRDRIEAGEAEAREGLAELFGGADRVIITKNDDGTESVSYEVELRDDRRTDGEQSPSA